MSSTITALTSGGGLAMAGDTSGQLQLLTNNGTAAVTIDTSQNVGIGTASPASKLQIGDATVSTTNGIIFGKYASSDEGNLPAIRQGSYDGVGNDMVLGATSSSGTVRIFTGGANSSLDFGTTNNAERMRIDSSGRVLVGTTNTSPAINNVYGVAINSNGDGNYTAGTAQFSANGSSALNLNRGSDDGQTVSFRRSGTQVGNIVVTSSTTSYNTSSDYRLKENIAPMTGALDKVSALKPCTYTWKSTGEDSQGFIAHELAEVMPDCVNGDKDAVDGEGNPVYQGIDTSFLVATLTAAIQELNAKVDAQAAEIQALKGVV